MYNSRVFIGLAIMTFGRLYDSRKNDERIRTIFWSFYFSFNLVSIPWNCF